MELSAVMQHAARLSRGGELTCPDASSLSLAPLLRVQLQVQIETIVRGA